MSCGGEHDVHYDSTNPEPHIYARAWTIHDLDTGDVRRLSAGTVAHAHVFTAETGMSDAVASLTDLTPS